MDKVDRENDLVIHNQDGPLTINGTFTLPPPTRRQRRRMWLRDLADRTLVPLGLMHYSGCWCERCQDRFYRKIAKEDD